VITCPVAEGEIVQEALGDGWIQHTSGVLKGPFEKTEYEKDLEGLCPEHSADQENTRRSVYTSYIEKPGR